MTNQKIRVRVPSREQIWKRIRELKTFTITDLVMHTYVCRNSVLSYVDALFKGGFLTKAVRLQSQGNLYTLVKDTGIHAPVLNRDGKVREPNGPQRMWMAMKALKRFDARDLALASSVYTRPARIYCDALQKAGYLKVITHPSDTGVKQYLVVRAKDSGPLAPHVHKDGRILDRNQRKIVWPESEAS